MARSDRDGLITLGPGDKVAIVAGSGRLPADIAVQLAARGHAPFVVLTEGEADAKSGLADFEHESIAIEDFANLVPMLKRHGATHLVMAGGIARRPRLSAVRPSLAVLSLLRYVPRAITALAKGDDALLRMLVGLIEEGGGVRVVGAHQLVPELLAAEGRLTKAAPLKGDRRDIDAAMAAARALGALDIGQAAVAIGGRVVAVEGIEGTDGLLERVRDLRSHGRLAGKKRGVLVKCAKPGQELRTDLPAIGPATVTASQAAGLAGIAVEAGRSLVLDQAAVIAEADRLGLFVFGLPPEARA